MITRDIDELLKLTELKDFDDNWNLTKYVSSVIDESVGRGILIHILDIWSQVNEDAKQIWLSLVERAGFYPYYIQKMNDSDMDRGNQSIQARMRTAFFKSNFLPDVYFHEKQKEIERAISMGDNVAVSAPTSFGKSLLIEEVVARNIHKNILKYNQH